MGQVRFSGEVTILAFLSFFSPGSQFLLLCFLLFSSFFLFLFVFVFFPPDFFFFFTSPRLSWSLFSQKLICEASAFCVRVSNFFPGEETFVNASLFLFCVRVRRPLFAPFAFHVLLRRSPIPSPVLRLPSRLTFVLSSRKRTHRRPRAVLSFTSPSFFFVLQLLSPSRGSPLVVVLTSCCPLVGSFFLCPSPSGRNDFVGRSSPPPQLTRASS